MIGLLQTKVFVKKVRAHVFDLRSPHRQIAIGFGLVSLYLLVAKLAGAGREMCLAWRYGVTPATDAFLFVYNLATLPSVIWFSTLTVVLLPILVKVRAGSSEELKRFQREFLGATICAGLLGAFSLIFFLPTFLNGYSGTEHIYFVADVVQFINPLSLVLFLGFLSSLLSVWVLSIGKQKNTLFEAIPPIVLIIILCLFRVSSYTPLILGTVVGFSLQLMALIFFLIRRREMYFPILRFSSPIWSSFVSALAFVLLGQVFMSAITFVDQSWLVSLGEGAISVMNYAAKLNGLGQGIVSIAFTRSLLPKLSEINPALGLKLGMSWAKFSLIFSVFLVLLAWPICPFAVKLILQRGHFTFDNAVKVTELLRALLLQLPVFCLSIVLGSILIAQGKYKTIMLSGITAFLSKTIGNFLLVDHFGVRGVALSWIFVFVVNSGFFFWEIKRVEHAK